MGSRKKKANKVSFISEYKKLTIHQRINLKYWYYWYGREKLSFIELKARFDRSEIYDLYDFLVRVSNYYFTI